jgi:hypothetical protein
VIDIRGHRKRSRAGGRFRGNLGECAKRGRQERRQSAKSETVHESAPVDRSEFFECGIF